MISFTSSWGKVALGLQKVAYAVANKSVADTSVSFTRIAQHGIDLAQKASTSLITNNNIGNNESKNNNNNNNGNNFNNNEILFDESNIMSSSASIATKINTNNKPLSDVGSIKMEDDDMTSRIKNKELLSEEESSETSQRPNILASSIVTKEPSSTKLLYNKKRTDDTATAVDDVVHNRISSENQIRSQPTSSASNSQKEEEQLNLIQEGNAVPSSRFGRAFGFARLGAGLAFGTLAEGASRLMGSSTENSSSLVVNDKNSDRLAASLCRMRGAALKMGQMLSIQDESLMPKPLSRALQQVRQGAEAMPNYQLEQQLISQLGENWRDQFVRFDQLPFAAASIGQVHRASIERNGVLHDVVVKVQYPGVAKSIESDLHNLAMLVQWSGLAPKGLFIENVIRVGKEELKVECDYQREMRNQMRIKDLVDADTFLQQNKFIVPNVYNDLTTDEIITSEYLPGGTIDKIADIANQEERNRIGRTILYLTMKELFDWRFMQTDPNWGNFLYDVGNQSTGLIDFGAAREYSKDFVDGYLRIVWASSNQDEDTLMEQSYKMGFLTGEENAAMLRAHKLSGFTVGEPFQVDAPFDFRASNISHRMSEHTSIFLKHRLTPPPEEVYTLHRKLAGAYMLCIKLGAIVQARDMLETIVRNHNFQDGTPNPITR